MNEGRRRRKALGELLAGVDHKLRGSGQTEITGLAYDSRQVHPGDFFLCRAAGKLDGHSFIPQAVAAGAAAVMLNSGKEKLTAGLNVPVVVVPDTREAMAAVATAFYEAPSKRLCLTGITGTSGKTTTSYLVASILKAAGRRPGIIGTLAYRIGDESRTAPNTTPEAPDLQALLAEMVDVGLTDVVMEVSSHALALHRVDGCQFRYAIFTNLSRDHLDFHPSLEDYLAAKIRLFSDSRYQSDTGGRVNILNADDPASRQIAASALGRVLTYGINEKADVQARELVVSPSGSEFTAETPAGRVRVRLQLVGPFNVCNALAALATGVAAGLELEAIAAGLEQTDVVPGRFQRLAGAARKVIVDYAHKPDALEQVLAAARASTQGRVSVVFGCGGDRDPGKRPQMGAIASRLADRCYVTSDNPRSEDPDRIISAVLSGIPSDKRGACVVEPDREKAIRQAIVEARPEDVVLIAGKGHETYQIFADRTIHFDDCEVAEKVLQELEPAQ